MLLAEYIRRGRPGDGLSAGEVHLLCMASFMGQTAYRLEARKADNGKKQWILDNGMQEKDITGELEPGTEEGEQVLKADSSSGRAFVVSQQSHLIKHSD
jgi:hypothetical protein